jgi:hypothetical protein
MSSVDQQTNQTSSQTTSTAPVVQTNKVLDKDAAQKVLQDVFKDYKTIDGGNVQVLPEEDFKKEYDKVYGATEYSWAAWVVPNFGTLNGFAYNNINYINKDQANTGTTVHEMLHNNAASDWRPFVGTQFDEGCTDVLKQEALKAANLTAPNSYQAQVDVVEKMIASGLKKEDLFTAYLKSGAETIVGKFVNDNCKGSWAEFKDAMEKKEFSKAKNFLEKKA